MQIHLSSTPAVEAGKYISEVINSHEGDVLCLLSGGSALDVVEYINIKEKNECRKILFIMGDERVSGEPNINNSLQLQNLYPEHSVTEQLIETVPNLDETATDFANRIEKNIL